MSLRTRTFAAALLALCAAGPLAAQPAPAPSASPSAAPLAPPDTYAVPKAPPWDPWPHGRPFGEGPARPGPGAVRLCSLVAPLCVHAERQGDGPAAVEALREAEQAYAFFRLQSLLPPPEGDGTAGGSPSTDLYLTAPGAPLRLGFEVPTRFPFDRAPVYALLDRSLTGCARRVAVFRAVATAMLASIDAGEAGASFSASTAYLAMVGSGCRNAFVEAIDEAQAHPELPLLVPGDPDAPRPSPLLPWMLELSLGTGAPGSLLAGLWYGGLQSTSASSPRTRNVPDLMAVVASLAKGRKQKLDDLLLDLAIARAFLGDRDDGQHLPESAWVGAAGRVRFDASWAYGSLPRRAAFTPLGPTGMVYAWIDLTGAPEHPSVGFRATWEYPITMRWALLRISPDGYEISRLELTHQRGDTSVDRVALELEGVAGLLVVGVSAGEIDLDQPFHIDETPYELHGGTIHAFVP